MPHKAQQRCIKPNDTPISCLPRRLQPPTALLTSSMSRRAPDFANYDTGRVVVARHASYNASHINDDDNTSHINKDDKDDNACHIDDNKGGMLC